MPQPPRYYGENDLHFLTTSVYRRTPIFNSERFKRQFAATLADLRAELGFRLLGEIAGSTKRESAPRARESPLARLSRLAGRGHPLPTGD